MSWSLDSPCLKVSAVPSSTLAVSEQISAAQIAEVPPNALSLQWHLF